jgi:hypothetical protein
MKQVLWDVVDFDIVIDLRLVFSIVTEGIEDLGERDMRQMFRYLLGEKANPPQFYDSPYRGLGTPNHRLTAKQCTITYYGRNLRFD